MKASEFISSLFFLFSVFSFKMLFGMLDDRRSKSIRLVTSDKNHSISIQKIKTIGEKFDINFKISAEDQPNSPNPMGSRFEKEI